MHLAAHTVGLFKYVHGMAPLCGGDGEVQARAACADNGDALAHLGRGGNGRQQLLEAGAGVHGALGIAYGVVGDGLPIERRQQVRPISVAVGIGAACCPDVADKRRPRPSAGTLILPRRVPDPPGREIFPRAAGFQI